MGYMHINNLYKFQDILLFKQCYAMEKLHGCLEANTQIETQDGIKTIKQICEEKYSGKVKSYDIKKGDIVFSKIEDHFITEETEDWFKITLSDGKTIIATSNHRFWIDELLCWRELKDLNIGDNLSIT